MNYTMPMLHGRDNVAVKSCRLVQQSKPWDVCFWGWATRSEVLESWSQIMLQGQAFPSVSHDLLFLFPSWNLFLQLL